MHRVDQCLEWLSHGFKFRELFSRHLKACHVYDAPDWEPQCHQSHETESVKSTDVSLLSGRQNAEPRVAMSIGGVVVFVVWKSLVTSFLTTTRRKPVATACLKCSKELQVEGVYTKHDREEAERRDQAKQNRERLIGQVRGMVEDAVNRCTCSGIGWSPFFRRTSAYTTTSSMPYQWWMLGAGRVHLQLSLHLATTNWFF